MLFTVPILSLGMFSVKQLWLLYFNHYTYKEQFVSLTWIDGDVFVSMDGNIGEDEMLQLGSSMRRIP